MKRKFFTAVATVMCVITSSSAFAQAVKVKAEEGELKVRAPGVKVEGRLAGDREIAKHFSRLSKLIGAEVKNSEGTSLGKVDDVMVDDRGNVRYFVMTHGGVLGVGQKYCALPFKASTIKNKEDSDTRFLEVNISPKTLEKAPTFTSDKWPDFRDSTFVRETDTFFNDSVKIGVDRK
jgi:sporulation protein YlmC with PRC-barrel domain